MPLSTFPCYNTLRAKTKNILCLGLLLPQFQATGSAGPNHWQSNSHHMRKTLTTLALCFVTLHAFAQSPARHLRPDAVVSFPNGNELRVLATAGDESFLLITSANLNQSFQRETTNQSNERMQSITGIRGFSRGGDGSCKLVVETARATEILQIVIGFSSQEIEKILQ